MAASPDFKSVISAPVLDFESAHRWSRRRLCVVSTATTAGRVSPCKRAANDNYGRNES
ncbi:hypothetical protein BDZ89DRAFT_1084115 [Hymenopellis radicata]|nr:hypothetical protein BDZ89DRAFT_1084115 [Hymenopellis radicata]